MAGGRPILFRIIKHKYVRGTLNCNFCVLSNADIVILLDILPSPGNMQWQSTEDCCKSMSNVGLCPTSYARICTLFRSPCSLNFPYLCDIFLKILVPETIKCHQLQGDFVPLVRGQGDVADD